MHSISHVTKVSAIMGGMAPVKQQRLLAQKPHVVIATPGRLWELIQDVRIYYFLFSFYLFSSLKNLNRRIFNTLPRERGEEKSEWCFFSLSSRATST